MLRGVFERLLAELEERYEVEILFVDDGSADGTRALLEEVAPALHGRVLCHERNRGIAEAYRTGFREGRGEALLGRRRNRTDDGIGGVGSCRDSRQPRVSSGFCDQLQPLVEPHETHFRQVPLRTRVKLPQESQGSPS